MGKINLLKMKRIVILLAITIALVQSIVRENTTGVEAQLDETKKLAEMVRNFERDSQEFLGEQDERKRQIEEAHKAMAEIEQKLTAERDAIESYIDYKHATQESVNDENKSLEERQHQCEEDLENEVENLKKMIEEDIRTN